MVSGRFPQTDDSTPDRRPRPRRVTVFGEALVDIFPSGPKPGGAPLNVARHLAGLGFAPLLISRIGGDVEGELIIDALVRWGVPTEGIQRDDHFPTGRVFVRGTPEHPAFDISEGAAWDHIDGEAASLAASSWNSEATVFGTLVRRSGQSERALEGVLDVSTGTRIVDLNLREPWHGLGAINSSLRAAQIAKLSISELIRAGALLGFPVDTPVRIAEFIVRGFGLRYIAVTQGSGDILFTSATGSEITQMCVSSPCPPVEVVDAVGAGDAFTAVLSAGAVMGWAPITAILRAHELARAVCEIRGAVPDRNEFYEPFRAGWSGLP